MNSKHIPVLFFLLFIFLTGCTEERKKINVDKSIEEKIDVNSSWNINGYIIDEKENNSKLVVWNVAQEDITSLSTNKILELPNVKAMWVSMKSVQNTESLSIGDKIFVWIDPRVEDSFPAHGTATRVEMDK